MRRRPGIGRQTYSSWEFSRTSITTCPSMETSRRCAYFQSVRSRPPAGERRAHKPGFPGFRRRKGPGNHHASRGSRSHPPRRRSAGTLDSGHDPKALCAVLKYDGRRGLVIGNGPVDQHSLTEVLDSIAGENVAHACDRERPGPAPARLRIFMFAGEGTASATPVCCILPSIGPKQRSDLDFRNPAIRPWHLDPAIDVRIESNLHRQATPERRRPHHIGAEQDARTVTNVESYCPWIKSSKVTGTVRQVAVMEQVTLWEITMGRRLSCALPGRERDRRAPA